MHDIQLLEIKDSYASWEYGKIVAANVWTLNDMLSQYSGLQTNTDCIECVVVENSQAHQHGRELLKRLQSNLFIDPSFNNIPIDDLPGMW